MKSLFIILTLFLVGCTTNTKTPPEPDVFMREVDASGYTFQLWERADGSKYLKNAANQKVMDLP